MRAAPGRLVVRGQAPPVWVAASRRTASARVRQPSLRSAEARRGPEMCRDRQPLDGRLAGQPGRGEPVRRRLPCGERRWPVQRDDLGYVLEPAEHLAGYLGRPGQLHVPAGQQGPQSYVTGEDPRKARPAAATRPSRQTAPEGRRPPPGEPL
jgi:hypothetical protein